MAGLLNEPFPYKHDPIYLQPAKLAVSREVAQRSLATWNTTPSLTPLVGRVRSAARRASPVDEDDKQQTSVWRLTTHTVLHCSSDTVAVGALVLDGWVVTFGTATRSLAWSWWTLHAVSSHRQTLIIELWQQTYVLSNLFYPVCIGNMDNEKQRWAQDPGIWDEVLQKNIVSTMARPQNQYR